jgi:hypothetical protein
MEPGERLKTLMSSKASAMKQKLGCKREQAGRQAMTEFAVVDAILQDWPTAPKLVAEDAIERYGLPNEATYSRLIWYNNGPWKRTEISRDEIPHNFPTPHTDYIMQYIDYRVPPERISDVALFDGSVIVDRTAGEVAARCDMESMNILSLNLLHDLVTGKATVESAREKYAEEASAHMMDRPAPYTERLLFKTSEGDTADLDEAIIGEAMMHQAAEKAKDVFRGEPPKY